MLRFEGSAIDMMVVDRSNPSWRRLVLQSHFDLGRSRSQPGGFPLVVTLRPEVSLVLDERPAAKISLSEVVARVIREDAALPMGQFDRFEIRTKTPDGQNGRWDLRICLAGHADLVVEADASGTGRLPLSRRPYGDLRRVAHG